MIEKGDKYNRLTAVKFSHIGKSYKQYWLFKCDCGKEKVIYVYKVKSGDTKSCGCLKGGNFKHRMYGTKIYRIWQAMKSRCLNPNNQAYKNYGGRGIIICERWNSFKNFYKDMGDVPKNKSIDRIKNNKGYYKSNCKWSTKKEQQNNTRSNRFITYKNKTQTMAQWARELNMTYSKLNTRIHNGWSVERAFLYN